MKTKAKIVLAGVAALCLAFLLLRPLVHRIDSATDARFEKAAVFEAKYGEMTNAYVVASEMAPDHPVYRLWQDRRAELLKAGYLETRELRLGSSLADKGSVPRFFMAFHSRFPGIERSVRDVKSDSPIVTVTARKTDLGLFGEIERFVTGYQGGK